MKTLTIDVRPPSDSFREFVRTWKTGQSQKSARISFASPEVLWQVLTARRWEILRVLCGAGSMSIREAARRVGRDVKAVHGDIVAMVEAGLVDRTDAGGVVFPFDAIKVEFMLRAA